MEETTTVAHVLQSDPGAVCDLKRRVTADLAAFEVCLEQGAHLGITGATLGQDGEMESKGEKIDQERNDDQTNNAGGEMGAQRGIGHLGVAKLVPEVLNGVETDHSGDEQADELDAADETQAKTSHEQPEEPLGLEALLLKTVELSPAEDGGDSAEEEHRVEQDKAADGGIRVLAEDHEGDEPDSRSPQVQLLGREVGQGNAQDPPESIERAHEGIVKLLGIGLTGLELEGAIVSGKDTGETDEDFAEGRVTGLHILATLSPFDGKESYRRSIEGGVAYTSKNNSRLI